MLDRVRHPLLRGVPDRVQRAMFRAALYRVMYAILRGALGWFRPAISRGALDRGIGPIMRVALIALSGSARLRRAFPLACATFSIL
jgi:hypothetical protein